MGFVLTLSYSLRGNSTVKKNWIFKLLVSCVVSIPASMSYAGAYSDAVLATSPTSYFQMGEDPATVLTTLADSSPNSNDGTWGTVLSQSEVDGNEPPTITVDMFVPTSGIAGPGPSDGFTGLDAGNLAADLSGNPPFDDGNTDLTADHFELPADGTYSNANATVSFLMRQAIEDEHGNDARIFTTENFSSNPFLIVNGGDASPGGLIISTQDFQPVQLTAEQLPAKSDESWDHVVVVRNGSAASNAEVWFNGVKFSGNDLSPVFDFYSTVAGTPLIGSRNRDTNAGFGGYDGELDEFAYWDRALSDAEVDGLYAALFAGGQTGDFDGDGDVDGADFLEWQRGNSPNLGSAGDLLDWENNYGAAPLSGLSTVPEPSSALLIGIGILATGCCRLKRTKA